MFKGIITPIVTPFNRDAIQSINYPATQKLINHLIAHGVKGIFALGSNGEFQSISDEEKIEFVKYVVQVVDKRVPVFAGSGSCVLAKAIKLSKEFEKIGVSALSILPPYFIKPSDDEIINYFKIIASNVKIPIILYNIPKNTGYAITNYVFDQCLKIENIIGIKDSSGNEQSLLDFITIAKKNKKFVWVGSDSKISFAYQNGAIGAIAGTSNLITDILVNLDQALNKGQLEKAKTLQLSIDILRTEMKKGTVPSILKRSIELANISEVGPARKPLFDNDKYDQDLLKMIDYYKRLEE